MMRSVPEDNLAYAALLKLSTGFQGSGFLLNAREKLFLITAKHILFKKDMLNNDVACEGILELVCQTKDLNDDTVNTYRVDLEKINMLFHPTADVAGIELGKIQPTGKGKEFNVVYNEGIERIHIGASPSVTVEEQSTKPLENVLISNDVFLYGYPTSIGLEDSPQFDINKPLMRKGIVAAVNSSLGTVVLDCPVYYGNSGGPVVQVSSLGDGRYEHKVIGVVSKFIPFEERWRNNKNGIVNIEWSNSGYSVAVSMNKVFEMLANQHQRSQRTALLTTQTTPPSSPAPHPALPSAQSQAHVAP